MNNPPSPGIIRAAARASFYDALEVLRKIAFDPKARNVDRIKAAHELGAFGLGSADQAAVHIHAGEGSQVIGVVHLPTLDPVPEMDAPDAVEEAAVQVITPVSEEPAD